MSIFANIKAHYIAVRKARDTYATASLSSLVGDITKFEKDKNVTATDLDVIAIIKKYMSTNFETQGHVLNDSVLDVITLRDRLELLTAEYELFKKFIPVQFTNAELTDKITTIIAENSFTFPKSLGAIMKELNQKYAGLFSAADASNIAKSLLTGTNK